MKRGHLGREIVETIALALLIFLVIRFAIQSYRVDGVSMQPNFQTDQYVIVNKLSYLFHPPDRGDVIVFHWPLNTQRDFIKRVIGVPGDTISTDSTTVKVNGVVLDEKAYISIPANPTAQSWKLGPNEYFVMGDNRSNSDDSRDWGILNKSFIIGKAVAIYWPLNSWQIINTYSSVYAHIPNTH